LYTAGLSEAAVTADDEKQAVAGLLEDEPVDDEIYSASVTFINCRPAQQWSLPHHAD